MTLTRAMGISVVFVLALAGCVGGEPAGTAAEQRTVAIDALDALGYDPPAVSVAEGETITLVVTNTGELEHEFIVGDKAVQDAHEEAMRSGTAHMDEGEMMGEKGEHMEGEALAALSLDPGETEEVTIAFDDAGQLEYACHIAGHYAGGMVGQLTVS